MLITLLYHDVVDEGEELLSGFAGPIAARYKLSRTEFAAHLEAVAAAARRPPVTSPTSAVNGTGEIPWILSFDDGGSTALSRIAGALEDRSWRGLFFITTGRIGTPGFLDAGQIRELHDRGHVIGAHSENHPPRMSALEPDLIREEWRRSCSTLATLLNTPVEIASVPGGYYSRGVAEAAAQVGIRALFTSEPTARPDQVGDCKILGRYTIRRGTPASVAAAIAAGATVPRLTQALSWKTKKLAKVVAGRRFIDASHLILRTLAKSS